VELQEVTALPQQLVFSHKLQQQQQQQQQRNIISTKINSHALKNPSSIRGQVLRLMQM
jgi:hypothetical protein